MIPDEIHERKDSAPSAAARSAIEVAETSLMKISVIGGSGADRTHGAEPGVEATAPWSAQSSHYPVHVGTKLPVRQLARRLPMAAALEVL